GSRNQTSKKATRKSGLFCARLFLPPPLAGASLLAKNSRHRWLLKRCVIVGVLREQARSYKGMGGAKALILNKTHLFEPLPH
ncbi:hypothetical protein, partial [Pseudomonas orientalis]|uniref:hypothetical protein n=1 Tax=Pseudomonas orientalis TaxID=76758 RepID=UPI001C63A87E